MSTKRLQRTVIEGGRHRYNKWERRYSHAETRAEENAYISEVTKDLENAYDYDIPKTRSVGKGFTDKLGPMYRWLHSQVGRPWDDVRAEVAATFDVRTTAGRHIVHDHLLRSVEVTPDFKYGNYYRGPIDQTTSHYHNDFYVDDEGILQMKTYIPRKNDVPRFNTNQIANWINGRVVGYAGKKLFWFVPADKTKKHGGYARQWKTSWGPRAGGYNYYSPYYNGLQFSYLTQEAIIKTDKNGTNVLVDGHVVTIGYKPVWRNGEPTFRQDRKLNEKELAFWNTIPLHYQTKVLERSPTYPTPPKVDYFSRY